jgi:hypothetical protein
MSEAFTLHRITRIFAVLLFLLALPAMADDDRGRRARS